MRKIFIILHTPTHTHTHTHTHIYIYTKKNLGMHINIYIYTHNTKIYILIGVGWIGVGVCMSLGVFKLRLFYNVCFKNLMCESVVKSSQWFKKDVDIGCIKTHKVQVYS